MKKQSEASSLTQLATASVGRLLWRYSLPAVAGMLIMSLYNVVDRVFIGQIVGADAIAGLAITFPVMNLSAAIGVLVGVGAAARISILLGADDAGGARMVLGNALTLIVVNALIYLTLFGVFIDPLLMAFGASPTTLPYAHAYMQAILPGMMMMNLGFSFTNILRATGYPVKAMVAMMIGAGLNFVLDPLFLYVFEWGIAGAAVATDISMAITAAWVLRHFCRKDVNLGFGRGTFGLHWRVVWPMIAIGAAPSLINAAGCLINILINRALYAHGGDGAVATAGIFVTYTSLLTSVVLGVCQGMQPIVGYNYGAGHYHRLRRAFWLATIVGTAVCAGGQLVGMIAPGAIARMFTPDAELIAHVNASLPLAMSAFFVVGFQIVSTTLFQSIGNAGKSIILSLTRQVVFLIPLLIILPAELGLQGVWTAFPTSDLLATAVTLALIIRQMQLIARKSA